MQFQTSLFTIVNSLLLLTSRSIASETPQNFQLEDKGQTLNNGFQFWGEKSSNGEILKFGDRYSYPETELKMSVSVENQYLDLVAELRSFVSGLIFRYQEFKAQTPRLKQKLVIIRDSVEHRTRYRKLEDYYIFAHQLLTKMEVSADAMSTFANIYYNDGDSMSQIHELRVVTLSLFDADGAPDFNMKGYEDKVRNINWKWAILKAGYENLEDKPRVHDFFIPFLDQIKKNIERLQKAVYDKPGSVGDTEE